MKTKILITCPPMLKQIDSFKEKFDELNMSITTPEVLQTLTVDQLMDLVPLHDGWIIGDDPATAEVFKAGKSGYLKAAVKWGIGVDNVDFSACEKLSIPITNTPGMFGAEVADLAMCYLLGLARDAFFIDREIRAGNWPKPAGMSLKKKVLGIVGLGDIGRNIAKRANSHDLEILGWDPYVVELPDFIEKIEKWPDSIQRCDFIIFACALTEETKYLFNHSILDKLKSGVRIINISRGHLVEEAALMSGLDNGIVDSAALDVFEDEPLGKDHSILKYDRCILGSHNASNTIDAVERASTEAINSLHAFLIQDQKQ